MTEVVIIRKEGRIVFFSAEGHAGFAEHGEDIVCAALSTALQFPIAHLDEVLDIVPRYEISEDGLLKVDFRGVDLKGNDRELNVLLEIMYLTVKQLAREYSEFIKLVEKEEK
ncbi:ribosomal-processing cysteine protease Prp [uncultured Ilyobacter sp.]|uniref:ribosomal-processing cysteine protease Prp n=1 Tax=uncultured Ilyobacter sp. TaxID=544433 RepID=UPI0029F47DDC|nr:ribosomal-processing cysteine protease Prp [uncultured Ilyobacter sp.]